MAHGRVSRGIIPSSSGASTQDSPSQRHRELTGSEAGPPRRNRRTTGAILAATPEQTPLLAVFTRITTAIATVDTALATPAADHAGTITSVYDVSYVMLLLRPPRGPPRLRR